MEELLSVTSNKVITCKAAVVHGPGEALVVEEIMVEPPKKMEVRIKILFTSICHSDLGAWLGTNEAERAYPRILGHEASGIVESVGEGVKDVERGDYVITIFHGECGECVFCKSERTNVCEKNGINPMKKVMGIDGRSRFWDMNGNPIFHFLNTSTFSEYTVMDSACVVKIDPNLMSLKHMALLSCCISTGVGAAWNTANVKPGSAVAVFGLGSVGLAVVEGAKARGATQIIGVDVNPDKQTKGSQMGITNFINPSILDTPVHEKIKEMCGGGVDYSFECVGSADVLREAFLSTHLGWGLTVAVGVHSTPKMLPLHPMDLFYGRKIVGSTFGDFKGKSQLPSFAQQCCSAGLKLDEFITHELPFENINQALQLLVDGKSLRCLLYF
ncbi:alcohol dehydrogenase-like 3 [Salvia hispanica]|uniref:alcohol dehydrogenase-like 3 n=1 Tax=Salvia hispanica TaxID=49212 RepID=UPI002008F9E8|nr:alcohol dehydrogenase-like 3 [Salvia hispanica]